MTTMVHKHTTATVVYVDPSATGANNGTTPANARTTLPTISTLAASTVYLIRRGAVLTVAPGTSTSKHGLGIIGMPKSTDALYNSIPAEAKTAWDADAGEYAQLNLLLNAASVTFNTTNGLTLFRLDCVSTQSIAQPAVPFFKFTTVNMLCVEKCRSRISGIDLNAMTEYNAANDKILTSWLMTSCMGISVKSCWFERPYDTMSGGLTSDEANGRSCVLDIVNGGEVYVEDCDFYVVFGSYASTAHTGAGALHVTTATRESAVLRDLRFKLIEIRDATHPYQYGQAWLPCIVGIADRVVVDTVTITAKKIGTPSPVDAWQLPSDPRGRVNDFCINFTNDRSTSPGTLRNVELSNVSIDLTGLTLAFCGISFASGGSSGLDLRYSGRWTLKNVTILVPQSVTGSAATGGGVDWPSGPAGLVVAGAGDISVENIDVQYTGRNAVAIDFGNCGEFDRTLTAGNEYEFFGSGLINATAVGFVVVQNAYADIRSVTMPFVSAHPLVYAMGAAQVYVDTMVLPAGYVTTENPVYSQENSQILIKTVNATGTWSACLNAAGVNNHVAVANADGAVGAWKSYSPFAYAITSMVNRRGSAPASIYVKTPAAPTRVYGPWLAPFPYAAKTLDPGGTGRRVLQAYIATRGFTTIYRNIFASIQILIESPAGTYPKMREYLSATDGWMEADPISVWDNDAGLVAFKICVPFYVDRYEAVGVRIQFIPVYENTAYFYLDPKLEIVAG